MLDRLRLYANTARHLRPTQWVHWPLRKAQALLPPPRVRADATSDPRRVASLREVVVGWGPGNADLRLRNATEILEGTFRFLNRSETLPEIDWTRRYVSHLWSFNLHYFDYAVDLGWAYRMTGDRRFAERFEELADGWMDAHPTRVGDGWEPYPVSLRIVNWLYAFLLLEDALSDRFQARLLRSVALHASLLDRRLEWHLLANHLQKNFHALTVAGLAFEGASARRWRRRGTVGLWKELFEQVLPDGGHFERSPMYHAIALKDFLEALSLCRAAGQEVPAEVVPRLRKMTAALGVLSRPDGGLHLFNDAAHGIAAERAEINALARETLELGIDSPTGLLELPDAGYFGWHNPASGERILIDCGEVGPRYQPGHAHCDMLSFELDLARRPVVVDAGVSGYGGDPLREYARSTRAHNTVTIAGLEQSEVWGVFRVGRRATVIGADHSAGPHGYRFTGAYTPYHDRSCVHRRTIDHGAGRSTVTDRVEGADGLPLASFLHLHPDFEIEHHGSAVIARAGTTGVRIEPFGIDTVTVRRGSGAPVQGWHCPEFGVTLPAVALEMHVRHNDGRDFGYGIDLLDG